MEQTISYFGAYYHCPEIYVNPEDPNDYRNGQPILHGAPRLHYIKCAHDVYYVRLAKDYLAHDKHGEFACDATVWSADDETAALSFVNGNDDMSHFHPITQTILQADLSANIPREDILEERAGIMVQTFLGFVASHVFMIRPDLGGFDEIETEGEILKIPRFNKGNWALIDNPEYL